MGIKSGCERNVQYRLVPAILLVEQLPCIFNSVLIQIIEKTDAESGIDHLRQVIDGTPHLCRQSRQRQVGLEKYLLNMHQVSQLAFVIFNLCITQA